MLIMMYKEAAGSRGKEKAKKVGIYLALCVLCGNFLTMH